MKLNYNCNHITLYVTWLCMIIGIVSKNGWTNYVLNLLRKINVIINIGGLSWKHVLILIVQYVLYLVTFQEKLHDLLSASAKKYIHFNGFQRHVPLHLFCKKIQEN